MMDNTVYPHAALGFRVWKPVNNALAPLFQGAPWRPGTNLAYCNTSEIKAHTPPGPDCHCGFNVYHALESAEAEAAKYRELLVVGAIAGKGEIQVHKDGFRCEQAQVLAICLVGTGSLKSKNVGLGKRLAERYQIKLCETLNELAELAEESAARSISLGLRPSNNNRSPRPGFSSQSLTQVAIPVSSKRHTITSWAVSLTLITSYLTLFTAGVSLLLSGNILAWAIVASLLTMVTCLLVLIRLDPERG